VIARGSGRAEALACRSARAPASSSLRSFCIAAALAVCSIAVVGCTTTRPTDRASGTSSRASIDAQVDASLSKLYDSVAGSRELVASSRGVLVFPSVVRASLGVGSFVMTNVGLEAGVSLQGAKVTEIQL
jgi:lipid-binding SYLF domain-containing protein